MALQNERLLEVWQLTDWFGGIWALRVRDDKGHEGGSGQRTTTYGIAR